MNARQVDDALQEWGNRVFNGGPVKKRIRKGMTGLRLLAPQAAGAGSGRMDASQVRRRVHSLVKRRPQVMVRISGGGKTIRHIKAHLDYISRNGQLPLEDQQGDKFTGKDDLAALRDEWRFGGFAIDDNATTRQAFNIILSMPDGTRDVAVLRAAREFAASEFQSYQYAMALHTFDTDPDAVPSPNPHVHLCVKAIGLDGVRLNPRKADLQRWREAFAERLREHGVECEATPRLQRLQSRRGDKQSVRHKKERGERFDRIGIAVPDPQRIERARMAEAQVVAGYQGLAQTLAASEREEDRQLALELALEVAAGTRRKARDREVTRDRQ
ncbi:hypothetical protein Q4S45_08250 [Massilia sp. R2A-15]|uniref:relaxase/mobilization nuclease domain-containing protein n=1 Tax=Massilia sp. R2A-15 TaxID=3064278 RepID=UPI00273302CB|nr:relaxase/mobilization nuclease domain-containing protein [Massilia sp. R2A-15]WLI91096.1 hypothetical protein Q4S45_08250 [Massilia sp. R2A-15]